MAPCRTLRALQPGYAGISGRFKERFHSVNMGQGSGALAWLTGDFTGDGTTEIAQLWSDNGKAGDDPLRDRRQRRPQGTLWR